MNTQYELVLKTKNNSWTHFVIEEINNDCIYCARHRGSSELILDSDGCYFISIDDCFDYLINKWELKWD